jgi:hypothetical protein
MREFNSYNVIAAMLAVSPKDPSRTRIGGVNITREYGMGVNVTATCGAMLLTLCTTNKEIACPENTSVTMDGTHLRKMLKLFSRSREPLIRVISGVPYLSDYPIDTIDEKFVDVKSVLESRNDKTYSNSPQEVDFRALTKLAKAMDRLVKYATLSNHDCGDGFKLMRDVGDDTVIGLLMPTHT